MVDAVPPRDPSPENRTTGALIQSAFQHVNGLIRGEIALARTEVEESLRAAAAGVGMLAIALALVLVALNVLAAAIVAGLTEAGLHPGWAALIVGGFFLIAAGVLAMLGKSALDPVNLTPTRTARNLRRDVETLKEATNDTRG
ncbi:MAG: hypothetical protein CFE34_15120 [Rhodobacteraceae bacterium PARR1]|nr:MAG: hypothetical protein CFE34_15120 [Rhodobacteraceae bacterium PARR1]